MKIFFAYSSRGEKEDHELYYQIAALLRRYGKVFSERIGDVETFGLGNKEKNVKVYHTERSLLLEADILIADVSEPSLGVGYEIALAEQHGKRILCLYRPKENRTLSSMIAGNNALTVRSYASMMDVDRVFREFLTA